MTAVDDLAGSDDERREHLVEVLVDAFADLIERDERAFRRKFRKMAADPFAFYRGTAPLFYADVASLGWCALDGVGQVIKELSPYEADLDWGGVTEPTRCCRSCVSSAAPPRRSTASRTPAAAGIRWSRSRSRRRSPPSSATASRTSRPTSPRSAPPTAP